MPGVFLVPANAKGVTRKGYPTQDGLHAADITLTGVEVGADAAIGDPENALPLIERVVDEARTAMCAEAVGAMDESLKTTVEYLKTRKQFGVAIGTFQTLQHRAADMGGKWSPDGRRIVFSSTRDGREDLFVMAADGSNPVNVTNHPDVVYESDWSPDGRHLAFYSNRGGDFEIFVMRADGTGLRQLTPRPQR